MFYVLYLFSFTNTHSSSVTDLLVYRRKSDKVAHRWSLHERRSINSRNVNQLLYMHCFENRCFINDCVDKKTQLSLGIQNFIRF